MKFVPQPVPDGGSLVGNSNLSSFACCPREWAFNYFFPFKGGEGIRPEHQSTALTAGSTFHEGMAALYRSGCKDGEYHGIWDLDLALSTLELTHTENLPHYASEEKAEEDLMKLRGTLTAYFDTYSAVGGEPEQSYVQVLFDEEGEPLIERDFQLPLGYNGYFVTCRTDLIINYHGSPAVMEHKTTIPGYFANQRINSIDSDSQATMECFILASLFPDTQIHEVFYNVVIKGGVKEVAKRRTTRRDHHDFITFRQSALDILQEIDRRTEGFRNYKDAGYSDLECLDLWFPDHGTKTGRCEAYRGCPFQQICQNKARFEQNLEMYKPRIEEKED